MIRRLLLFFQTIAWAIRHPRYTASQFATGQPFSAHDRDDYGNVRGVMPLLLLLALMALPAASCNPPVASAAPVMTTGPMGFNGALLNAGDSLGPYIFKLPAPLAGATGYSWTVTASKTNGTWTNLPTNVATTADTIAFTMTASGGVWDSATFSICVKGTSPLRSSKASFCQGWQIYRYIASPTSLLGDSSHIPPISFMIRSMGDTVRSFGAAAVSHMVAGGTKQFCAYVRFGDGHVGLVGTYGAGACDIVTVAHFKASRITGYTVPEQNWLAGTCSNWTVCLLGMAPVQRMPLDALLTHRS